MSASLTDQLMQVAAAGTLTTLAAPGKALAAGSINIANPAGWPTTTGFIVAIRQVDSSGKLVAGTYTEWIGTLSGSTITLNTTPVYGSDQVYAAGSTTQVFIPLSSYGHNLLITALLEVFNQDMTFVASLAMTTPVFTSPTFKGLIDGWVGANESWAYASSTTITVPSDATTKYDVGDYIKLTQSSTVKYFVVTGVTSTVLTVQGMQSATVANSAITANYYSKISKPHGIAAGPGATANVATSETSTSSTYTDLATAGPAVTVTVGESGNALVCIGSNMANNTASGDGALMSFAASGANTISAGTVPYILFYQTWTAGALGEFGRMWLVTGLTPGVTTFTAKYAIFSGGTGTWKNRSISVVPL